VQAMQGRDEAPAQAELEHFIGYGGKHLNTVHYHPTQAETLIYAAAAVIIIEDVNDPHKQEFLRGHDAEVSAIDVSANGKLVASGQLGSPTRKGAVAPVVIWDFDNRAIYMEFNGLAHSVLCVRFSPDGRFLVATGANQMIFVWDVSTGEQVYSRRTESPCFLGAWGPIVDAGGRYPSYQLCTTYDSQVFVHSVAFDIRSMCYKLESETVQFPSAGLQRKHLCGIVRGDYLITGTSAGDICVFNLQSKVFRTALPVANNGVQSLTQAGDIIYVAGGDGRIKALRGDDAHWDVMAENVLESGIVAITASSDGAELVAGTKNGKLFRLLTSDLTATLQGISHTGEVTGLAFNDSSSESLCTVSEAGEVFVIDLSDYLPITTVIGKAPARTVVVTRQGEIIAGYDDGSVRCWSQGSDKEGRGSQQLWSLNAHRGGVTVVRESADFIVTGGNDFAVRFWHRTTRELLATFHNHKKPVQDIIIDNMSRHIVHSGAEDRLCVTYDLKQNKALIQHSTASSNITGITQRKDREHEVISASTDGKMLFWDVDYADPVGQMESPDGPGVQSRFRCLEVSPSGRYIAVGTEDARMLVYDLMACVCIQECLGHSQGLVSVRWSPDQKQIASAGKDGCVIIWNFFEKGG